MSQLPLLLIKSICSSTMAWGSVFTTGFSGRPARGIDNEFIQIDGWQSGFAFSNTKYDDSISKAISGKNK